MFFKGFNYTFKWVDDHKYGKRNRETGEWNGMMGELLAQVSILLTATYESPSAKKVKAQRPEA